MNLFRIKIENLQEVLKRSMSMDRSYRLLKFAGIFFVLNVLFLISGAFDFAAFKYVPVTSGRYMVQMLDSASSGIKTSSLETFSGDISAGDNGYRQTKAERFFYALLGKKNKYLSKEIHLSFLFLPYSFDGYPNIFQTAPYNYCVRMEL